jgi:NADH:ubiquinone oxidoreductase subunit F (NADH-binding)
MFFLAYKLKIILTIQAFHNTESCSRPTMYRRGAKLAANLLSFLKQLPT